MKQFMAKGVVEMQNGTTHRWRKFCKRGDTLQISPFDWKRRTKSSAYVVVNFTTQCMRIMKKTEAETLFEVRL